ncbi:DNA mismatch repair protein MutS [Herbaspirillum sp. RU 5E]|uniref:DNA mismatch repair protein MutS n=3 Tax=Pseudomonadota TaxID=1224 RepID=A0A225SYC8_9BURK|nr:DNA mismatch repair protein MutS [Herbaspirillum sp. RU 5E]MCP3654920.1 DNA mismatch repair protein MutS [Herbaspirillum sp.]MRT27496.1 DNA mismatch repair protein MutS [Herbaspirillum sp. CAH-3]OWY36070.1 DNA mismatch repair protein MutS [Herbaspirillum aquaticum]MCP3945900.1 DNA mismatch repair protein MutS [Herbaspirillum sp.]
MAVMATMKDFSALQGLRRDLQEQEKARALALAERQRQEAAAREEANIFRNSIGQVAPLRPEVVDKAHYLPEPPLPIPRQHLADEQAALLESLSDEFTVDTLMDSDENLSFARPGVGMDVLSKLRRGNWVIQAQLDLHGYRRDQAREALGEFLRQSRRRGLRCVRVIHGKGLGSVNKEPVLKHKVRNWLAQKDEVMAFCQARAADGGAGALVVLLRSSERA